MWGAAPRPGREKFSLHPRHVCDVPTGDVQEMQEIQEIQERPQAGDGRRLRFILSRSHRRQGRQLGLQPPWILQASKLLNFQASN